MTLKTECNCEECVSACKHYPGWMTPQDAKRAIEAGLATKLMMDYYAGDENLYVLCPAIRGFEGNMASFWPDGQCVFLENDKCQLHETNYKPKQCKDCFACETNRGSNKIDFVEAWKTPEAKSLIEEWARLVRFNDN